MKNAGKIASLGVVTGLAVSLLATGIAAADDRGGLKRGGGMGAQGGLRGATFAELDVDGNGSITEEDLLARAQAKFAETDTDGSGTLSAEELAAGALARMEAAKAAAEAEGKDMRRTPPAGFEDKMAERLLEARDANEDGALSQDELAPKDGYGRMIDRFDTDDDNALSEEEFAQIKAEHGDRKGPRGKGHGHDRDGERKGQRN
ncbi:MAG: hypothetical protein ACRBCL_08585 [Maritimibacter sp.]